MTAIMPAAALVALNLLWIAVLARVFFRPGQLNFHWWLNTAPFVLSGVALIGGVSGRFAPLIPPSAITTGVAATLAALLCAASFGLMGYAVGTHHRRPALWRQSDDAPEHLVTTGPYARIRHPFYSSYLITLLACVLVAPHWSSLLAFAFGCERLNATAALEEGRFLASPLGPEYRKYMRRAGRFMPRWRSGREGPDPVGAGAHAAARVEAAVGGARGVPI